MVFTEKSPRIWRFLMNRNRTRKTLRLVSLLLAFLLAIAALPMQAFAVDITTIVYKVGERSFLALNRFTGALENAVNIEGDLVIPSKIQGVDVTSIADGAFYGAEQMTSVTVPASVRIIGDRAFGACTSLRTANLESGVTRLGKDAFRYCYALTSVALPSTLTSIESYTFASCLALRSITIPSSVTSLGSYSFYGCRNLTSIALSDNIREIGDYAFGACTSLASINMPSSLTFLPTALFYGCSSLSQVKLYSSVKYIGKSAFGGCSALTRLALPDGVEKVYESAFDGCKNLTSISMPNSIDGIAYDAFDDCDNVTFYVNAGSYSQVFAAANGIPFVLGTFGDPNGGNGQGQGQGQGQGGNYPSTPFIDAQNHWAKESIEWAYAMGYISGTSTTTFSPNQPLTRGMLVSILYRIEGSPATGTSSFTDVPSSKYYAKAVAWAKSIGVVSGITATTFRPEQNITREQLASILHSYARQKGMNVTAQGDMSQFKDTSSISSYAGTALSWAVGAGIVSGKGGGTLDPKGNATRAEAATMLKKFTELK